MRILLWNCCNGINQQTQIDYFNSFKPDLAILPELKKKNIQKLAPNDSIWITNNHTNKSPKGLGILTFNGFKLEPLPRDEEMEIFIPTKVTKDDFSFNLLAVWSFYHVCKQGRFKDLRGPNCLEYTALEYYKNLYSEPSLIAGDWNLGPTYSPESFIKILGILEKYGHKSLYHEFYHLKPHESNHQTFKPVKGKKPHHIDHFFGSVLFQKNMTNFHIDKIENAVLSDHAPLILDVDLTKF